MPQYIFSRAIYVIEENLRTLKSVEYLKNCDYKSLGNLMYLSHDGLKNLLLANSSKQALELISSSFSKKNGTTEPLLPKTLP